MDADRHERGRMPRADDLDDVVQLRRALLDRDRRLVKLRAEIVATERWVEQIQSQAEELQETADNARAMLEHLRAGAPDLLEPEIEELEERIAEDD